MIIRLAQKAKLRQWNTGRRCSLDADWLRL